jgi:hypothetical protein
MQLAWRMAFPSTGFLAFLAHHEPIITLSRQLSSLHFVLQSKQQVSVGISVHLLLSELWQDAVVVFAITTFLVDFAVLVNPSFLLVEYQFFAAAPAYWSNCLSILNFQHFTPHRKRERVIFSPATSHKTPMGKTVLQLLRL